MLKGDKPCPKIHYHSVEEMPISVTRNDNKKYVPYGLQYRPIASPCCRIFSEKKGNKKEEDMTIDDLMIGYTRNAEAMDILPSQQTGTLPKDISYFLSNSDHCNKGGNDEKVECFMRIGVSMPYKIGNFLDCMAAYYRVAFTAFQSMKHLHFKNGQYLAEYIAANMPPICFILLNDGNTLKKFRSLITEDDDDEEGFNEWIGNNFEYMEKFTYKYQYDVYRSMKKFRSFIVDKRTNKNHHDLLDIFSPHKYNDWITGGRNITYMVIGVDELKNSWLSCPKYNSTRRITGVDNIAIIYYNRICYEPIVYTKKINIVGKEKIVPVYNFHPSGNEAMSRLLYKYKHLCHSDELEYDDAKKILKILIEKGEKIMSIVFDESYKIAGVTLEKDVFMPFPRAVSNSLMLEMVHWGDKIECLEDVKYNGINRELIESNDSIFKIMKKVNKGFYTTKLVKNNKDQIIGYKIGNGRFMLWFKGKEPKRKSEKEFESEEEEEDEDEKILKMKEVLSERLKMDDMEMLELYRHHMNPYSRQDMFQKTVEKISDVLENENENENENEIVKIVADHMMIKGVAGLYSDIDKLKVGRDEFYLNQEDIDTGDYKKKIVSWENNPFVRDSWEDNVRYVDFKSDIDELKEDEGYKEFVKILNEMKSKSDSSKMSKELGLDKYIEDVKGEMADVYPLSVWKQMLPKMKYVKTSHKSYNYKSFVKIFEHVAKVLEMDDMFNETILRNQMEQFIKAKYDNSEGEEWVNFIENVMNVNPSLKNLAKTKNIIDAKEMIKYMKRIAYKPSVLELQVISNTLGIHIVVIGGKKKHSMVGKNGYWIASFGGKNSMQKKHFVFLQYDCTLGNSNNSQVTKDCMSLFPIVFDEKRIVLNHTDIKQDTIKFLVQEL
jgi:hypothetical protein